MTLTMDQTVKSSTLFIIPMMLSFGVAVIALERILWWCSNLFEFYFRGLSTLSLFFLFAFLQSLALYTFVRRNNKISYGFCLLICIGITIFATVINIFLFFNPFSLLFQPLGAAPVLFIGILTSFLIPLFFKKQFTKQNHV